MKKNIISVVFIKLKKIIRNLIPKKIHFLYYNHHVKSNAKKFGVSVENNNFYYRVIKQDNEIRVSTNHAVYIYDIIENFDYFFASVKPIVWNRRNIVDFSTPRWHWVTDFDDFPILFPSFVDPVATTKQYLAFADLKSHNVVLDLGAYSGLTSILFSMAIPTGERVIALEADKNNAIACRENFLLYEKHTKKRIELIEMAIWKNDLGVNFSSEGNMGSSAVDIVGSVITYIGHERGENIVVPSLTLVQLVEKMKIERVDFIKCDIEGAETEIFDSPEFFSKFSPKILIECHMVNGELTAKKCIEILQKYGYSCELVNQHGFALPLLLCTNIQKQQVTS